MTQERTLVQVSSTQTVSSPRTKGRLSRTLASSVSGSADGSLYFSCWMAPLILMATTFQNLPR